MEEEMTNVIGIIVAMDSELELLMKSMTVLSVEHKKLNDNDIIDFHIGQLGDAVIVVTKSGIGKVNAAICTTLMCLNYHPSYVISTGVCGSLEMSGDISQNDIVLGETVRYHDVWCGNPNKLGQVQGMPEEYESEFPLQEIYDELSKTMTVHLGNILSGDWFVDDVLKARDIVKSMHRDHIMNSGEGLDMESGSIAQTCYRFGVPFLSARIVSDCPLQRDDSVKQYDDFWETAPQNLFNVIEKIVPLLPKN